MPKVKTARFAYFVSSLSLIFVLAGCAGAAVKSINLAENPEAAAQSGLRYYLPTTYLKVWVTAGYVLSGGEPKTLSLDQLKVEIGDPIASADTSAPYLLLIKSSSRSDDHHCFKLNEKGLLETVDFVGADRTGDIITSIAGVAGVLVTPVPGAPLVKGAPPLDFRFERKIVWGDPFEILVDPENAESLEEAQQLVYQGLAADARELSIKQNASLRAPENEALRRAIENREKLIDVHPVGAGRGKAPALASANGVFYRLTTERVYSAGPVIDGMGAAHAKAVQGPDPNTTGWIEVSRAALTRKSTELRLKDGALVSVDVNKPSEALAVASLPLEVAGAVIETPARFFTKIAGSFRSETSLLRARAELLQAQAALEEVRKGAGANPPPGQDATGPGDSIGPATSAAKKFESGLVCASNGQND